MAEVAGLSVRLQANIDDFRKNLKQAQNALKRTFGNETIQQSQRIAAAVSVLGAGLGGLGAMAIKAAADMEQTRMAFTTLLKDGQKANVFLEKMEKFAKSTPFDLPGVLNASKQLLAFGFEAEKVIPILTALGDTSAALSLGDVGIQRLTLAIGQMNAAGKVTTQDMKQLVSAGVPAFQYLAEAAGVSVAEIQDKISKGAIDSATGIKAIMDGMNSQYGGMMANQEKTILGMWANIQESLGFTLRDIGTQLTQTFNLHEKMEVAKLALENFSNTLKVAGIAEAMRQLIPPELQYSIIAIAGAITATMIPGLHAMAIAAVQANIALLPLALKGAAIAVAFKLLTDAGVKAKEAIILIAAVITATYMPAIYKFILATGTSSVIAIKGFIAALLTKAATVGSTSIAVNLLTAAMGMLKLGFIGAMKALLVFLIPFIKVIAIAAIVAGAAIYVYRNWGGAVKSAFASLASYIPSWASTMLGEINKVIKSLLVFVGLAQEANVISNKRKTRGISDEDMQMMEQMKKQAALEKQISVATAGGTSGGSKGGGGTSKLENEINRINERIVDMRDKIREAGVAFENFQVNQMFSQLEGANKVYGDLIKSQLDAYTQLDSELKRLSDAKIEAEQLYQRAVKAGNTEQINSTRAMLEQVKAEEVAAAEYVKSEKVRIAKETEKEINSVATANNAIRTELQRLQNEANLVGYMEYLTNERVAFLAHLEETQAMQQQYYDWRMEAEQSYAVIAMQMAETLKNGLASSISDAVVQGKNLGEAFKDVGKQIVAMFIQWQVKRLAAAVLSKTIGQQEAAAVSAQAATMASALAPAAWAKLVVSPESGAIATGLLTQGMAAAAAMGTATSGLQSAGGDRIGVVSSNNSIMDMKIPGAAKGGIVRRPTLAVVGEKQGSPEAIFPLSTLRRFIGEVESSAGGGVSIAIGEVNTEREYEDMLSDISLAVAAGRRGM
jgi:tape measure domain-containing protein|nr:MAG TPA: tail tape measure protein [Caudoviricetes sp.]